MPFEAGRGEHHVYRIFPQSPADQLPLTVGQHYVGIDAVSWFAEKQGNWYSDYMASGTLEIILGDERETYQVALGAFELDKGAKTAPVFDNPVLPDRCYRGGPIKVTAALYDLKKDTVIAGLLKSAASASLSVVAGMVQTATLTGPSKILGAAGGALIGGVKTILDSKTNIKQPLFDFTGIQKGLQPKDFIGPEVYILLHRGDELKESDLTVAESGQVSRPYWRGQPLEDGAWLLLRFRRSSTYSGFRDWFDTEKSLRFKLDNLIQDFKSDNVNKEDALKELKPGGQGNETLFDEFSKLRAVIQNDGVFTVAEATVRVGALYALLINAKKSIQSNAPDTFIPAVKEIHASLLSGNPSVPVQRLFSQQLQSVSALRNFKKPSTIDIIHHVPDFKRSLDSAFLGRRS